MKAVAPAILKELRGVQAEQLVLLRDVRGGVAFRLTDLRDLPTDRPELWSELLVPGYPIGFLLAPGVPQEELIAWIQSGRAIAERAEVQLVLDLRGLR